MEVQQAMTVPVFILAGQSNVGFLSSEIETAFDQQYGLGNYELIRIFDAGAPLTLERENREDWKNPEELREELTFKTVSSLLEDDDRVFGGMIWIQGEADTYFSGGANRYADELDELIDGFREDVASVMGDAEIGLDQGPITILELSNNAPDAPDRVGWDAVIDGQRDVAANDPFVQTLDPDTIAQDANVVASDMFRDGLHYTDDFGMILAEELVQTMVSPRPDDEVVDDEPIVGDPIVVDPVVPILPVADGDTPEDEMVVEATEDDVDDGGFGFESILFLLPLVPLIAAFA